MSRKLFITLLFSKGCGSLFPIRLHRQEEIGNSG